jgi:hypothetical protein
MTYQIHTAIDEFNDTYGSSAVFEARIHDSEIAYEKSLQFPQDAELEAIFARTLLKHTPRMALSYAWDYHYKNPRTYGHNIEITNDLFTLSFKDLEYGKIVFVRY